jgi:hypothetical protein
MNISYLELSCLYTFAALSACELARFGLMEHSAVIMAAGLLAGVYTLTKALWCLVVWLRHINWGAQP